MADGSFCSLDKATMKSSHATEPPMVDVPAHLRGAHDELAWYYHQREHDFGIRSNYGTMLDHWIASGDGIGRASVDAWASAQETIEEQMERTTSEATVMFGVARERRVRARLRALTHRERAFLDAFWAERSWPRALVDVFGQGLDAVGFAKSAETLPRLAGVSAAQMAKRHAAKLVSVRDEVHGMYRETLAKYAALEVQ